MKICTIFIGAGLMCILCLPGILPVIAGAGLPEADMAPVLSNSDSDGDGLPDWWEERYGGNPGPNDDPDSDKVTNLNEYKNGTHPLEADTDGDGVNDSNEIYRYGTDPLMADTDRGGNPDGYEISNGGSPLNPDDDDAPGKVFSISLQSGWNLFCLPVSPADTSLVSVLSSLSGKYVSVWSYQGGSWKTYDPAKPNLSKLTRIEPGLGYWIDMKENAVLNVSGSSPGKSIALGPGWNLVGYNSATPQKTETVFSSIAGKTVSVWTFVNNRWTLYNPEKPIFTNLLTIQPAYGYWIETKEACTWTLP